MANSFGGQTMVGELRRVAVRAPDAAFGNADPERWHYAGRPDLDGALDEHAALAALLRDRGVEVIEHTAALPDHADAIYVHDPVLVCDAGTIELRMGKRLRRGEENALAACLEDHGVPRHAALEGDARAEGGDLLWIDAQTLAVGQGFRTNAAGLAQLQTALQPLGVRCLPVPLPYQGGSAACLHLMSILSMIDHDLAVAYLPLLPVPFWRHLVDAGIEVVEVPHDELASQATNVLALAPRECVMLEGNQRTAERLRRAGCEVIEMRGEEISHKGEGGPTCLTRPVLRA